MPVNLFDPDGDERPQFLQLQFPEMVAIFQEPKGLADHFARREISTTLYLFLDQLLEFWSQ